MYVFSIGLYRDENAKTKRNNALYKFDLNKFQTLLDSVISIYDRNLLNYNPSLNINQHPDNQMLQNDENGYIRKIKFTKDDKIIIFGDFHGSFHTFFRIMLRLHIYGVVNIETYTINDNYKLIFLGDIIDRGQYSLEIFEILFRFIQNDPNNNKIIINRGNHETYIISSVYGFKDEIRNTEINYTDQSELFVKMLSFFRRCPSAIILHNNAGYNYWLCHGYIPNLPNLDEEIKNMIENNIEVLKSNNIKEFLWNDPNINNIFITEHSVRDARAGTMFQVGVERLDQFRKNTKIHFIIRGHSDIYANASLLANRITMNNNISPPQRNSKFFELGNKRVYRENQAHLPNLSTKLLSDDQYIDGSVENIFMNGDWTIDNEANPYPNFKVYPVLTIATNTDEGRNLICDSFIVLHTTNANRPINESVLRITPIDINDYLNTNVPDSLLQSILTKPFLLEQSNLKNDDVFLLQAIQRNPQVIQYSDLRTDKTFLLQAIRTTPQVIQYTNLRNDKDFLLQAVRVNLQVLQYSDLNKDFRFVSDVMSIDYSAIKYIDPSLRSKFHDSTNKSYYKNKYLKYKAKYLELKKNNK